MNKRLVKVVQKTLSITGSVLIIVTLLSFTMLLCSAIVKFCWTYLFP